MKRDRIRKSMFLHQTSFVTKILNKFKMQDSQLISTPMEKGMFCVNDAGESGDISFQYREAIGSLMFLSLVARLDITYPVNFLSRYLENPKGIHWDGVKRIFRYLNGTRNFGILFQGESSH